MALLTTNHKHTSYNSKTHPFAKSLDFSDNNTKKESLGSTYLYTMHEEDCDFSRYITRHERELDEESVHSFSSEFSLDNVPENLPKPDNGTFVMENTFAGEVIPQRQRQNSIFRMFKIPIEKEDTDVQEELHDVFEKIRLDDFIVKGKTPRFHQEPLSLIKEATDSIVKPRGLTEQHSHTYREQVWEKTSNSSMQPTLNTAELSHKYKEQVDIENYAKRHQSTGPSLREDAIDNTSPHNVLHRSHTCPVMRQSKQGISNGRQANRHLRNKPVPKVTGENGSNLERSATKSNRRLVSTIIDSNDTQYYNKWQRRPLMKKTSLAYKRHGLKLGLTSKIKAEKSDRSSEDRLGICEDDEYSGHLIDVVNGIKIIVNAETDITEGDNIHALSYSKSEEEENLESATNENNTEKDNGKFPDIVPYSKKKSQNIIDKNDNATHSYLNDKSRNPEKIVVHIPTCQDESENSLPQTSVKVQNTAMLVAQSVYASYNRRRNSFRSESSARLPKEPTSKGRRHSCMPTLKYTKYTTHTNALEKVATVLNTRAAQDNRAYSRIGSYGLNGAPQENPKVHSHQQDNHFITEGSAVFSSSKNISNGAVRTRHRRRKLHHRDTSQNSLDHHKSTDTVSTQGASPMPSEDVEEVVVPKMTIKVELPSLC